MLRAFKLNRSTILFMLFQSVVFQGLNPIIDHFKVVGLVSQRLGEREAEVDLVFIQTSFLFLWKLCLKNTSQHKNNMIYIIKQEGLNQDKVNSSLFSTCNFKMGLFGTRKTLLLLLQRANLYQQCLCLLLQGWRRLACARLSVRADEQKMWASRGKANQQ